MTERIPQEVIQWARLEASPGDTMVDSTGQKWWRGEMNHNVEPNDDSVGSRIIRAARAAHDAGEVQGVVWDSVELKRIND